MGGQRKPGSWVWTLGWAPGGSHSHTNPPLQNVFHYYLFVLFSICCSWVVLCQICIPPTPPNPSQCHVHPLKPIHTHLLITIPIIIIPMPTTAANIIHLTAGTSHLLSCLWLCLPAHYAGTTRVEFTGGQASILGRGKQKWRDMAVLQRGNFGCKWCAAWLDM